MIYNWTLYSSRTSLELKKAQGICDQRCMLFCMHVHVCVHMYICWVVACLATRVALKRGGVCRGWGSGVTDRQLPTSLDSTLSIGSGEGWSIV